MVGIMRKIVIGLWCAVVIFSVKFTGYATRSKNISDTDVLSLGKKGISVLDDAVLCKDDAIKCAIFDSMIVMTVPKERYSSDLSLGIVDLKFDGENLKICELGEGPRSMFKGFDKLYRQGLVWRMLWHFLSCLELTPWVLVNAFTNDMRLESDFATYESLGGHFARNLQEVPQDEGFISCLNQVRQNDCFADYNAVIIMRNNGYRDNSTRILRKKYPKVLVLCEVLGRFGNNKLLMNALFEDDELRKYRPKCMILGKKYFRTLAKTITDKMQCDCFVIKPINSSKGNGVIVVKRRDLFRTLRAILKNPKALPNISDPTYGYWLHDRNKSFLVEEYAPSKLIEVHGEKYDATMRVIFVLFCDHGKIGISFLGSYWKLPAKSINEPGLLTEKHKSSIKPDHIGAAKVDVEDYEKVKGILRGVLPKAYIKMLQDRENYS